MNKYFYYFTFYYYYYYYNDYGPVLPGVDVQVADDDGVEAVRLGGPLQHRLEPSINRLEAV